MKKLMTLILALSLLGATVSIAFAQRGNDTTMNKKKKGKGTRKKNGKSTALAPFPTLYRGPITGC